MTILVVDLNVFRKCPKKKKSLSTRSFCEKVSWMRRKFFIAKSVDLVPVARAKVDAGTERNESRQFFIIFLSPPSMCAEMFFKRLLGLEKTLLRLSSSRKNEKGEFVGSDGRGRASSTNRTGNEEMEAIK